MHASIFRVSIPVNPFTVCALGSRSAVPLAHTWLCPPSLGEGGARAGLAEPAVPQRHARAGHAGAGGRDDQADGLGDTLRLKRQVEYKMCLNSDAKTRGYRTAYRYMVQWVQWYTECTTLMYMSVH